MTTLLEIGLVNAATATVLALVAAAASLLCRRPAIVYCLWLLVLVKLVSPPLVRLPVEVTGLLARGPLDQAATRIAGLQSRTGAKSLPGGARDRSMRAEPSMAGGDRALAAEDTSLPLAS